MSVKRFGKPFAHQEIRELCIRTDGLIYPKGHMLVYPIVYSTAALSGSLGPDAPLICPLAGRRMKIPIDLKGIFFGEWKKFNSLF